MGSKHIERTTLGLQTDKPTDRRTNRPTIAKQYAPLFKAGIKIIMVKFEITTNNKSIDRSSALEESFLWNKKIKEQYFFFQISNFP